MYIVVKATLYLLAGVPNENDKAENDAAFKNDAPFRSCISKINNMLISNSKHLDMVMPMYNLLEYSDNYSFASGNLWNYCRDDFYDVDVSDNASDGKSFNYKTKIVGETPEIPPQHRNPGDADQPEQLPVLSLNLEVTILLKHLSNFWRSLDLIKNIRGLSWMSHGVIRF